jgi:hypothetical protein
MNGPSMNRPSMNRPSMNSPIANIPAANGPLVNGSSGHDPVRVGREYTGKHRRDSGPGPLSPRSRAVPDGSGPRPEEGPWADAG